MIAKKTKQKKKEREKKKKGSGMAKAMIGNMNRLGLLENSM